MNFLLALRRAFTPESSPLTSPPTSRPTTPTPIPFTLTDQGARVLELTSIVPETPVPETPQRPIGPISPLQRNAPATYKERVGIHTLRHMVGLSYRRISTLIEKPISIVSDIANHPTTPPNRPDARLLATPERIRLISFIRMNANHRRMTYGQLSHALGYNCSHDTIRRALAEENYSRFKARSAPFITDINQVRRVNYVDISLQLPIFHWQYCAWSDEGKYNVGGY
jgi:hypothetical protein